MFKLEVQCCVSYLYTVASLMGTDIHVCLSLKGRFWVTWAF